MRVRRRDLLHSRVRRPGLRERKPAGVRAQRGERTNVALFPLPASASRQRQQRGQRQRPNQVLATGAFFGLVAYATYDLTNLATLEGWPVVVTVVDLCWGMVLTASVAAAGYAVAR